MQREKRGRGGGRKKGRVAQYLWMNNCTHTNTRHLMRESRCLYSISVPPEEYHSVISLDHYTCADDEDCDVDVVTLPPPPRRLILGNDSYSIDVVERDSSTKELMVSSDQRRRGEGGVMILQQLWLLSDLSRGRRDDKEADDELTDAANASTVLGDGRGFWAKKAKDAPDVVANMRWLFIVAAELHCWKWKVK